MTGGVGKTVILVLLVLLCTAFIFSNSCKDGEASHADSDVILRIVEKIVAVIMPDNTWDWNWIVRKGAHLFEFCLLGIFSTLLAFQLGGRTRGAVLGVLLYLVLIASVDELIQRFTGRSSRLADVGIDLVGALIGLGLVLVAGWIRQCRKKKKI